MTITPAYGRDYKSKSAILEDWNAGKDFAIADAFSGGGTYINNADAVRAGVKAVTVRYAQLRKVAVIKLRGDAWA